MIKLKTSQSQVVLNKLINKNVLTSPVYLSPDGLIINPNDKEEVLKVFKELDLRVKSSKNILGRVLIS
tara:strand:- start:439 stop:642 length:204 start_codon:yes stop_codon:yes gene_type:complete